MKKRTFEKPVEDEIAEIISELWQNSWEDIRKIRSRLTPRAMVSVKRFLKMLTFPAVIQCMDIAFKKNIDPEGTFKYFCAVCWNEIKALEDGGMMTNNGGAL